MIELFKLNEGDSLDGQRIEGIEDILTNAEVVGATLKDTRGNHMEVKLRIKDVDNTVRGISHMIGKAVQVWCRLIELEKPELPDPDEEKQGTLFGDDEGEVIMTMAIDPYIEEEA